jgi:hypothetical protein
MITLLQNKITLFRVRVRVVVLNATFNNISVILWRSVLLVEKTVVPGIRYFYILILQFRNNVEAVMVVW